MPTTVRGASEPSSAPVVSAPAETHAVSHPAAARAAKPQTAAPVDPEPQAAQVTAAPAAQVSAAAGQPAAAPANDQQATASGGEGSTVEAVLVAPPDPATQAQPPADSPAAPDPAPTAPPPGDHTASASTQPATATPLDGQDASASVQAAPATALDGQDTSATTQITEPSLERQVTSAAAAGAPETTASLPGRPQASTPRLRATTGATSPGGWPAAPAGAPAGQATTTSMGETAALLDAGRPESPNELVGFAPLADVSRDTAAADRRHSEAELETTSSPTSASQAEATGASQTEADPAMQMQASAATEPARPRAQVVALGGPLEAARLRLGSLSQPPPEHVVDSAALASPNRPDPGPAFMRLGALVGLISLLFGLRFVHGRRRSA